MFSLIGPRSWASAPKLGRWLGAGHASSGGDMSRRGGSRGSRVPVARGGARIATGYVESRCTCDVNVFVIEPVLHAAAVACGGGGCRATALRDEGQACDVCSGGAQVADCAHNGPLLVSAHGGDDEVGLLPGAAGGGNVGGNVGEARRQGGR